MKRMLVVLLVVALLLGMTGAAGAQTAAEGTTFTFISPTDNEPASLNQLKGWTGDFFNNAYLLQAGLFRYQDGVIANELCTDYTVSDDGLVYTFTLRDANYSDGVAIKAADFVFMMKSYLDPANGTSGGSYYATTKILNADKFYNGEITDFSEVGCKAPDDHTLEITLSEANPNLLLYLADYEFSPLREDVLAEFGDAMGSAPDKMVYSGPYCLTDWTSGTSLTMVKNPAYWNAENSFPTETIVHLLVGDSNTTYSLYENDEADAIINLDAEYVDLLGEDVKVKDGNRLEMFWLNMSGASEESAPLMGNKNFRMALDYAIDREKIVAAISPLHKPYTRIISPMAADEEGTLYVDQFEAQCPTVTGDAELAKEYLAKAMEELGYASVDELPTIQFVTYENALLKTFAETIIDQWKQVLGISNVEFNQYAIGTALGMIYDADFDIFFIGNDCGPEAEGTMASFLPGGDYDFGCWVGEDYEAFVAALQALDGETGAARTAGLADAEQKFLDACFVFPIYCPSDVSAVKSYVSGMDIATVGKGYLFDNLVVSK